MTRHHAIEITLTWSATAAELHRACRAVPLATNAERTRLMALLSVFTRLDCPGGRCHVQVATASPVAWFDLPRRPGGSRGTRRSTCWACTVSPWPSTTASPACTPTARPPARWRSTKTATGSAASGIGARLTTVNATVAVRSRRRDEL